MIWTRFGRFEIAAIETGHFKLDGGAMFGVVPKNLWERKNPADAQNRIEMTMRTLVLRDAEHTILVDAGVGRKDSGKFQDIFAIEFDEVSLERGLKQLGIAPADVTDLIATHLHFDHIGGAVIRENDSLRLTFPNAMHHVQREQWTWACNPSQRDRASYMPDNFRPIEDAGKLQLLDGNEELLPGLQLEVVNGHTFGQQIVRIVDGDQSLVFAADLIPMCSHVPDAWIMGYDLQPIVTLGEKQQMLKRAVESGDVLLFEHDRAIPASLVEHGEKGYRAAHEGKLEDVLTAAGKRGA
ncbi:MBL fold metallo-hydrolase [bacterium]|nr:MBL fold metallo-hydrolase [bacterium]